MTGTHEQDPARQQMRSYVSGVSDTPLIGETIGRCFERAVERWGEREALVSVHQGIRWSYRELKERVDACAAGFLALGFEPGDRVGIWSHNNAEWLITQLATAKIGVILVNINPAYRRSELAYALNKVGCKGLVTLDAFKSSDYLGMLNELAPELAGCEPGRLRAQKLPALRTVIRLGEERTPGMLNFPEVAGLAREGDRERVEQINATLQFDDPINIQFTSGTTGSPKGATLTHHNILNNGYFVGEAIRLNERDRLCVAVPLYHCFGMVMGNLACISHGSAIVYPALAFDPEAVLEAVQKERCTALYGVPTMFIAEMGAPGFQDRDLSSLRTGIMAGSPCPMEVMKRVISEMHMSEVTIAYGMTETSPVSFQSSVDDPVERRVSTVGRVHPHLEVKIVDTDGRVVPAGTPGELCTRGYSVMLGYWDDEEKTREAVDRAGWMHTGDLATLDEEGYCNIVGRIKDMIIRGGENVYPREIEEFLYSHPAVEDVQVIGVPDEKYGEAVCAWIRLKQGADCSEEDIRVFCQGEIAHYKVPRYVRFVDEFPMTVTGKIKKFEMRRRTMEELHLEETRTA